nr:uncharacterized protein LOC111838636 [Paramormyrops kingsleyae]
MRNTNNKSAYREEVENLERWSRDNNLALNSKKTKELILDFRSRKHMDHHPFSVSVERVEVVQSFRFLGVHISRDLSWTRNTNAVTKKGLQRLHFLRSLKTARLPRQLLVHFYRCTIESVITHCITAWYSGCTLENRKTLQRIIKSAQWITGTQLPSLEEIRHTRCSRRAEKISKDPTPTLDTHSLHPRHPVDGTEPCTHARPG